MSCLDAGSCQASLPMGRSRLASSNACPSLLENLMLSLLLCSKGNQLFWEGWEKIWSSVSCVNLYGDGAKFVLQYFVCACDRNEQRAFRGTEAFSHPTSNFPTLSFRQELPTRFQADASYFFKKKKKKETEISRNAYFNESYPFGCLFFVPFLYDGKKGGLS